MRFSIFSLFISSQFKHKFFSSSIGTRDKVSKTMVDSRFNFCKFVPELLSTNHKGQMGRIGVIGGSREYTGAPYYAGISALKLGADLSFVFTEAGASLPIKSYSPELIVIPIYDQILISDSDNEYDAILSTMRSYLHRLHSVVIGPGLGRSIHVRRVVFGIIQEAINLDLPLRSYDFYTADFLFYFPLFLY